MTDYTAVYVVMEGVGDSRKGEPLRVFTSIEKMKAHMPLKWEFHDDEWVVRLPGGKMLWIEELVLDD